MSELRDRGLPTMEAVADGVAQTGHVITCAGLMMAIAFGGMLLSDVPGMRQLSFFFTLGDKGGKSIQLDGTKLPAIHSARREREPPKVATPPLSRPGTSDQ
eukprot:g8166.t1